MLRGLKKLLRRHQAPPAAATHAQRSAQELEQERDLLERVAAGIALNKTPGR